jgi:hypothetical protein
MRTSQKTPETITTIGIDLGKNTFHLVGLDKRGAPGSDAHCGRPLQAAGRYGPARSPSRPLAPCGPADRPPSFCSRRCPVVSLDAVLPIFRAA